MNVDTNGVAGYYSPKVDGRVANARTLQVAALRYFFWGEDMVTLKFEAAEIVIAVSQEGLATTKLAAEDLRIVLRKQAPLSSQPSARSIHSGLQPTPTPFQEPEPLSLFKSKIRQQIIFEDRITVCGVETWRDCADTSVRDALALLSRKENGNYVRIRGPKLNKELGRCVSNPIGKPLERYCKRVSTVLEQERGLLCGRFELLASKCGGYHYTPWMDVSVVGSWARELGIEPDEPNAPGNELNAPTNEPDEPMNERQQWIMAQVQNGIQLTLKAIVQHFRGRWDRSTINRDLKGLRSHRLIATHALGYYVRAEDTDKNPSNLSSA